MLKIKAITIAVFATLALTSEAAPRTKAQMQAIATRVINQHHSAKGMAPRHGTLKVLKETASYEIIGYEEEPVQVHADSTIISISQTPRRKLVRTTDGLEAGERGTITVDENYMTTRPGVFAAGDVVTGAKTVVHAVDGAKKAAEAMIRYMEQGQ